MEKGPKQPEERHITPYAIAVLGCTPTERELNELLFKKRVEEVPWWMTKNFGNEIKQPPPASP